MSDKMRENISIQLDKILGSSQPPTVTVIKGPWGSGKTYFIKEYLKNKTDLRYAFISVFNKKSLEEIDTEIILSLSSTKKISKKIAKVLKAIPNNVAMSISTLLDLYSKTGEIKNVLIVFDDVERLPSHISFNSFMGKISLLKEESEAKIVLIFNEEQLQHYDYFKNYKKMKEKIVTYEIEFTPDFKENFEIFQKSINGTNSTNWEHKEVVFKAIHDFFENINSIPDIRLNIRLMQSVYLSIQTYYADDILSKLYKEENSINLLYEFTLYLVYLYILKLKYDVKNTGEILMKYANNSLTKLLKDAIQEENTLTDNSKNNNSTESKSTHQENISIELKMLTEVIYTMTPKYGSMLQQHIEIFQQKSKNKKLTNELLKILRNIKLTKAEETRKEELLSKLSWHEDSFYIRFLNDPAYSSHQYIADIWDLLNKEKDNIYKLLTPGDLLFTIDKVTYLLKSHSNKELPTIEQIVNYYLDFLNKYMKSLVRPENVSNPVIKFQISRLLSETKQLIENIVSTEKNRLLERVEQLTIENILNEKKSYLAEQLKSHKDCNVIINILNKITDNNPDTTIQYTIDVILDLQNEDIMKCLIEKKHITLLGKILVKSNHFKKDIPQYKRLQEKFRDILLKLKEQHPELDLKIKEIENYYQIPKDTTHSE